MENHPIFNHIKNNDLEGVKALLSSNDLLKKEISNKGVGILSFSIAANSKDVFNYLIQELSENEIFTGDYDPLSLAINYNETEIVKALVDSGKINLKPLSSYLIDTYNSNPVNKEIVSSLNRIGLNFSSPSNYIDGNNQFDNIFSNPKTQRVIFDLNDEERKKLISFSTFNNLANNPNAEPEIIKELFKNHNAITEEEKDNYFNIVVSNKNHTVMAEFLNLAGFYPGQEATNKMIDIVLSYPTERETLFNKGTITKESLLNRDNAIAKISEFIKEYKPTFNLYSQQTGTPILSKCIRNHNNELFDLFLELGADVNEQSMDGETPLHIAVKTGNTPFVKKLLLAGASTTATNINSDTPVHLSVSTGKHEIFDLLMTHGSAYLGTQNRDKETALSLAIFHKDKKMISDLLWKGADIVKSTIHASVDNGIYVISTDNGEMDNLNPSKEEKTLNNFKELSFLGFDIEQRNNKGDSLAHHFIKTSHINNLKALLSLNVSPKQEDGKGNNLLMSAALASDEVFNTILSYSPANNEYLKENNEGHNIYDILIRNKKIHRIAQVLDKQIKFQQLKSDTLETINKNLHIVAYAGNLNDIEHFKKHTLNGNFSMNSPDGVPLTMVALLGKNINNFRKLVEIKPQILFLPNKKGQNTIDLIESITDKNSEFYTELKSIINDKFPENVLTEILNQKELNITINLPKDKDNVSTSSFKRTF